MNTFILINKVIFVGSLLGMSAMFLRKLPEVKNLPASRINKEKEDKLIRIIHSLKKFFSRNLAKRSILLIRNVNLSTEKIISKSLKKLKESPRKKRDDYWDKIIRTSKNRKKK